MREILYILMNNPVLAVLVVIWIFSGLAGAASKAAKRTAQQRKSSGDLDAYLERRRREMQVESPAPAPTSADEIARQMRELLGLETPRQAPRRREASTADAESGDRITRAERDSGDEVRHRGAPHVGELHEEIERRRHEKQDRQDRADRVPTAATKVTVVDVANMSRPRASRPPLQSTVRRERAVVVFDPKATAAALVAIEVLGPPRALRPHETDRFGS